MSSWYSRLHTVIIVTWIVLERILFRLYEWAKIIPFLSILLLKAAALVCTELARSSFRSNSLHTDHRRKLPYRQQGSSTPNNFTAKLVMHLSTPNILSILKVFEDKSVACGWCSVEICMQSAFKLVFTSLFFQNFSLIVWWARAWGYILFVCFSTNAH